MLPYIFNLLQIDISECCNLETIIQVVTNSREWLPICAILNWKSCWNISTYQVYQSAYGN